MLLNNSYRSCRRERNGLSVAGDGRKTLTGTLDVALIQSLVHQGTVDDRIANYGHLVVDECHHLSAQSFELVVRRAKAKFVTGLSATLTRKDGHHPIIFMQCGPVRHRIDAKMQAAARPFTHRVFVRPTGFHATAEPEDDPRKEFHRLCEALRNEETRNEMICADVLGAVREGRSPLLLTERIEHVVRLAQLLSDEIPHVITLQGGMGRKELQGALDRVAHLSETAGRVILATGRYIGEGFDDPRLDTLFLTLPVFSACTRKAKNCGERECIAFMTNFHKSSMFEFLTLNMRCRGREQFGKYGS